MIFHRTRGVGDAFIRDLEKILYWTTIVVQFIFFGYYGYSIYSNMMNLTFLVTYSLLLVLSTMGFIYYLANYRAKEKKVRTVKQTFRIFKYLINGSMVLLNMIEIIRYGGDELAYALIVFSAISLIIQIIVELIRIFITHYVDLFTIALDKDTALFKKIPDPRDVYGNLLSAVDAPLEVVNKLSKSEKKELSKKEKLVEELKNSHIAKSVNKRKEKHQKHAQRQKREIKEHFDTVKGRIFKKKNTESETPTANTKKKK